MSLLTWCTEFILGFSILPVFFSDCFVPEWDNISFFSQEDLVSIRDESLNYPIDKKGQKGVRVVTFCT